MSLNASGSSSNSLGNEMLKSIPYPLAIVGLRYEDKNYGCTVAWASQVSHDPLRFIFAVGKMRKTCEILAMTPGVLTVSLNYLDEDTGKFYAQLFGRKSCRDTDKWAIAPHTLIDGVPVLTESPLSIIGDIVLKYDMGSHAMILIEPYRMETPDNPRRIITYDNL